MFTLLRTYFNNSVHNRLSEGHIGVILEAIGQEFQHDAGFLGNTMVKLTHRLDCLDFEFDAKIWQIGTDLLEKLLYLVLVAGL